MAGNDTNAWKSFPMHKAPRGCSQERLIQIANAPAGPNQIIGIAQEPVEAGQAVTIVTHGPATVQVAQPLPDLPCGHENRNTAFCYHCGVPRDA